MGHFERPPYTESTMRSAYHVRAVDVNRLLRLSGSHIDIFLSHDWPAGIARHGDINALLRKKSFLRREIDDGSLGSQSKEGLNSELLDLLASLGLDSRHPDIQAIIDKLAAILDWLETIGFQHTCILNLPPLSIIKAIQIMVLQALVTVDVFTPMFLAAMILLNLATLVVALLILQKAIKTRMKLQLKIIQLRFNLRLGFCH